MTAPMSRRAFAARSAAFLSGSLPCLSALAQGDGIPATLQEFAAAIKQAERTWPQERATSAGACHQIDPATNQSLHESMVFAVQANPVANIPAKAGRSELAVMKSIIDTDLVQRAPTGRPERVQQGVAARYKSWSPGETVTYGFLDNNASLQGLCEHAVQVWSGLTGLRFQPAADARRADIRVTFRPNKGHYSLVGTDCRLSVQQPQLFGLAGESMNIDSAYPGNQGVVLHEFGHAVGLAHEHFHQDSIQWIEDQVYAHFWVSQGWDRETTFHNVLKRLSPTDHVFTGERDPKSVMHYFFPRKIHRNGVGTGSGEVPDRPNNELSNADMKFIRQRYGQPQPADPDDSGMSTDSNNNTDTGNNNNPQTSDAGDVSASNAVTLTVGQEHGGLIARPLESDVYTFVADASNTYLIETTDRGPSTAMRLRLYDSADLTKTPVAQGAFNGGTVLNAAIRRKLSAGQRYYIVARHVTRTRSSIGPYSIKVSFVPE